MLMKSCTRKSKNIKNKRRNSTLLKIPHYNSPHNKFTMFRFLTNSTMTTTTHTCYTTHKINNNLSTIMTTNTNTQIKIQKIKEKCLRKIMSQSFLLLKQFPKILYHLINQKKINSLLKTTTDIDIFIRLIFSRSLNNFISVSLINSHLKKMPISKTITIKLI